MKKKRLISLFLMVVMALAFTSSAFADVNMGSGDGTGWGDGTGDNVWSLHTESGMAIQAPEGLRITVYDAESNSKVFNTIDITGNPNISAVNKIWYFSDNTSSGTELIPKTTWLSNSYIGATYTNSAAATKYNNVVAARLKNIGYSAQYISALADLTIISENNTANLEAIKTFIGKKEFIVHLCSLIPNLNYEDFAAGKYKIAFEPVAYFRYKGQNYALTATEVGIYNKFIMNNGVTTGTMKGVLGPLTHSNLPRSAFLEYKDLGVNVYSPTESDYWGDSRYNTDSCIIRCMGIGTVGTSENTEELPDGEDAAEYHTDTDVYTSFNFINSGDTDYVGSTRFSIYNSDGELPMLKEGPEEPAYLVKIGAPSITHNPDGSVTVGSPSFTYGYASDEIVINHVHPTDEIRVFVENPDYNTEPFGEAPYKELGKYKNGDFISADGGALISYEIKTKSGARIEQGNVSFSCPAGEEAMGWFDWHTPNRAQDITITLKANSPGIYLLDKDGNSCKTLVIDASISKVEEKTPPDPKVTDTRPSWQKVYSSSSVAKNISGYAPKNDVTELSWYVWAYDWTQNELETKKSSFNYITSSPDPNNVGNPYMGADYEKVEYYADRWGVDNRYYKHENSPKPTGSTYTSAVILSGEAHKVEYTVSLDAEMSIAPSQRCYTATYSSSTGLYTMKSGYGIEITVNSHISGDTEFCTGAQIGNVLFPEFNYNRESSAKYNRLLEKVGNELVFKTNVYSTYGDRVHFLPIWYPDNKYYTVYAEVFDVWCPAGQLSMRLTDRLIIKGNVYDDWHVAPTKP